MESNKSYLGDSVYISDDGYMFRFTTENGYGPSNEIFMEPNVVEAFLTYLGRQRNLDIRVTKILKDE